ncbi:MAG: acyl-protein synthetase [Desulfobulbaceae bacterium]|nr:acyl-protein synthetase [Desulfobulbaceae bacterium]
MQRTIKISHLSREEKLRVMEDIWEDLSKDEMEVESPSWHQEALRKTKLRVDSGQETIVDWKSAKQELRKRFE